MLNVYRKEPSIFSISNFKVYLTGQKHIFNNYNNSCRVSICREINDNNEVITKRKSGGVVPFPVTEGRTCEAAAR